MSMVPINKSLVLAVALTMSVVVVIGSSGWHGVRGQEPPLSTHATHSEHEAHDHGNAVSGQWEGSEEGIAYSEFNHALAGVGIILVGLSELRTAIGLTSLAWSRFLLPIGMLAAGVYLMIWSDHDAWPIGSLSLAETLSGHDSEMLQHKIYAVLLLGIGTIESLIRLGRMKQRFWHTPLPAFAIVGGLMLFMHMHGPHPAAHQIMMHHNIMGTLAIAAGSCWFASEFTRGCRSGTGNLGDRSVLKIMWAILILIIGVQLLFYSES